MEIKYDVHSIGNSRGTGKEQPYVQLINGKAMTADELERQMEAACSVTCADIKAVMAELCHFAKRELSAGHRFYLPEIGYLSLSVGSNPPSEKPNGKITGNDIYLRNINFQPEKAFIKEVRQNVRFVSSAHTTVSAKYTEADLWPKVEDYLSHHRYITCRDMRDQFCLSDYMSRQWLARFSASGKLSKDGSPRRPLYFLNKE